MATYDLDQQEQLDQFKHFWKTYGNLITWTLVAAMAAYASWTGYLYWQNERATKASALYEELDRAAVQGDAAKVARVFGDMKDGYAGTTMTEQGALLAAQSLDGNGKTDEARASLQWLAENGKNKNLTTIAKLRLAGMLLDLKKYDEALKQLEGETLPEYAALIADRRGDILNAQGKKSDAVKAYQQAYREMDATVEYRRFIEGKLTALGEPPADSSFKAAPEAQASGLN